jgi:hypothetical protein
MAMLKCTKGRVVAFALGGTILSAACGDDPEAFDTPWSPVTTPDAGGPVVDAGALPSDAGLAPTLDANVNVGADTGAPSRQDAAPPGPGGGADTGAPLGNADGGSSDAGGRGDAGSIGGGSDAGAVGGGDAGPVGGDGGTGTCCPDGKCLCHGSNPTALTANRGPYMTQSYTVTGAGCVYYPTNAEAPFAAVAISDGFLGSGGCGSFQTGSWGPLYASWGIVAMIVNTGSLDTPDLRGAALAQGIMAFKSENTRSASPLNGKLAGRYGTSGFSMGGGGTTYAARQDRTLLSNIAIMPWGPVNSGVTVPTLVICGSSDSTASCSSHGTPAYRGIADTVPKMRIVISSGHAGQPTSGGGESGRVGLAFQKVFLEGDTRWRQLLIGAMAEDTNIR